MWGVGLWEALLVVSQMWSSSTVHNQPTREVTALRYNGGDSGFGVRRSAARAERWVRSPERDRRMAFWLARKDRGADRARFSSQRHKGLLWDGDPQFSIF